MLNQLKRFEEAKSLILKIMPAARRALGENKETTLRLRWSYAQSLCCDANATLDDLREATTTLEDTERTARRFLGSAHPDTAVIERHLRCAREILHERESPHT